MAICTTATSLKSTLFRVPKGVAFFRSRLTAIMLLCMAVTTASQAVAQACGSTINLVANQWRMVGLSCVPPGSATVGSLFASLGAADYNVTWVVWKRVYNDTTLCAAVPSPNDCYTKLTTASPVATGDAFWVYTTVAAPTFQFSGANTATPGTYFEFPATLSTNGNSRYYMFGNPYPTTGNWADFGWRVTLFGFLPYTGTTQQAIDNDIVSKNVYYWNGTNTYFTRDNTSSPNPAATFTGKQAAWFEFLQPNVAIANVRVRVPGP
jgi:hypothetical protein